MFHFIVNPASRSGRGEMIWHQFIESALKEADVTYQAYFSKRVGHIAQLVKEITTNNEEPLVHLVIVGGDGSFNEALQGISDFSKVIMSYIPTGSGNDLAKALGISKEPGKALAQVLERKQSRLLDIGVITYDNKAERKFAVSCGIGLDAAICEEVGRSSLKKVLNKVKLGKLTYLLIALKQVLLVKRKVCTVTLADGSSFTTSKFLFLTGMIHPYEGGGFCFCPKASAEDGLIDVCSAGAVPKVLAPFILLCAFWGKHSTFRHIRIDRTADLKVTSATALWVHTDGEVSKQISELHISCLKQVMRMVY
jgi:YegS/Rv2252/BmrU family lipid kinase